MSRERTTEEALAAWDAGEPVWSVEMGGIGPGYEQAIQLMAFEMLRAMQATPVDWTNEDAVRAYSDLIREQPNAKKIGSEVGASGAQHGAAMNIASIFTRQGYAKGLELAGDDRHILVSRNFPVAS